MLWRQLGWLRSVLASKLGADSSLLASPEKVKLGCWPLVPARPLELPPLADGRKSIHGTATCLPAAPEVEEVAPGVVLVELPGLVLLLEELAPEAPPLKEMTAHSTRPDAGSTMVSLMVPMSLPDEFFT